MNFSVFVPIKYMTNMLSDDGVVLLEWMCALTCIAFILSHTTFSNLRNDPFVDRLLPMESIELASNLLKVFGINVSVDISNGIDCE